MTDTTNLPWTPQPMKITVIDKGQQLQVSNVDTWVAERKQLLRRAREIMGEHDGTPTSLYEHYGALVDITARLAQIKVIFDEFNRERHRHADANIAALVVYFNDPKTMEGIDD